MSSENRRQFHRIYYPREAQPRFHIDPVGSTPGKASAVYAVIECSERGVRFHWPGGSPIAVDATLAGTVRFARGAMVRVVGQVVWVRDGEAAIRMDRTGGIPLRVIMDEQRYLRAHFAGPD